MLRVLKYIKVLRIALQLSFLSYAVLYHPVQSYFPISDRNWTYPVLFSCFLYSHFHCPSNVFRISSNCVQLHTNIFHLKYKLPTSPTIKCSSGAHTEVETDEFSSKCTPLCADWLSFRRILTEHQIMSSNMEKKKERHRKIRMWNRKREGKG